MLLKRFISALIVSSLCFTTQVALTQSAQAQMISTETFLARQNSSPGRERILGLLERQEVRQKMQEFGVNHSEAAARVASLTDSEIDELNRKIDSQPGGGDAAGTILGTALAVFIILLLTDILCWTKVFPFTRCAVK